MLGAECFGFFQPLFRATHRKKSTPKSRKWFESNPGPRFGFQPKTNFELPSSSSKEKLVFGRDFLGRRFSILFNFLTSKRQIRKKIHHFYSPSRRHFFFSDADSTDLMTIQIACQSFLPSFFLRIFKNCWLGRNSLLFMHFFFQFWTMTPFSSFLCIFLSPLIKEKS